MSDSIQIIREVNFFANSLSIWKKYPIHIGSPGKSLNSRRYFSIRNTGGNTEIWIFSDSETHLWRVQKSQEKQKKRLFTNKVNGFYSNFFQTFLLKNPKIFAPWISATDFLHFLCIFWSFFPSWYAVLAWLDI